MVDPARDVVGHSGQGQTEGVQGDKWPADDADFTADEILIRSVSGLIRISSASKSASSAGPSGCASIQQPTGPTLLPDHDPTVEPDVLSIDGSGPLRIHQPSSLPELCDLVRSAAGSGLGAYGVGGRTALDSGLPPTKPGFAVDTTALNQVIDYPARDMTITLRAGITIGAIQTTLAREGQWLPVDIPYPHRATLGGAVALNQSGPRRFGSGTLRDYVIGISFVTDDGDEVKAGGRVVKNVAGYDLMKLQTGAVGTLGIITQLTLKVKPKPETAALVSFACDGAALATVFDLLHTSTSRPGAVEVLNAPAVRAAGLTVPRGEWAFLVGFEEKAATVDWQVSTLLGELKAAPVRDVTEARGPTTVWQTVTDFQRRPGSRLIGKLNVPPSRAAEVLRAATSSVPYYAHAEPLNGIIWLHAPDYVPTGPTDPRLMATQQAATSVGGNFCWLRCPNDWKTTLAVWGQPTGDRELMRQVKRALDPKSVFNPGRLFGDLL